MSTGVHARFAGSAVIGSFRKRDSAETVYAGCCGDIGGREGASCSCNVWARKVRMLIGFVRRDDEGRRVLIKRGVISVGTRSYVATAASRR